MRRIVMLFLGLFLTVFLFSACDKDKQIDSSTDGNVERDKTDSSEIKDENNRQQVLDVKKLVQARCTRCHSTDRIYSHPKVDRNHWAKTVDGMIKKGAKLNAEERNTIIDYLAQ